MAKTKSTTPKKGAKAATTKTPPTTPRRTTRQPVKSAKKVIEDVVSTASKVVKRAAPAKATKGTAAMKKSPKKPASVSDSPATRTRSRNPIPTTTIEDPPESPPIEVPSAKKTSTKKSPAKKPAAKKSSVKESPAEESPVKTSPAKDSPSKKKPAAKNSSTKASPGKPRGRPRKVKPEENPRLSIDPDSLNETAPRLPSLDALSEKIHDLEPEITTLAQKIWKQTVDAPLENENQDERLHRLACMWLACDKHNSTFRMAPRNKLVADAALELFDALQLGPRRGVALMYPPSYRPRLERDLTGLHIDSPPTADLPSPKKSSRSPSKSPSRMGQGKPRGRPEVELKEASGTSDYDWSSYALLRRFPKFRKLENLCPEIKLPPAVNANANAILQYTMQHEIMHHEKDIRIYGMGCMWLACENHDCTHLMATDEWIDHAAGEIMIGHGLALRIEGIISRNTYERLNSALYEPSNGSQPAKVRSPKKSARSPSKSPSRKGSKASVSTGPAETVTEVTSTRRGRSNSPSKATRALQQSIELPTPRKSTHSPSKSPSRKGSKDVASAEPTPAKRGRPRSPAKPTQDVVQSIESLPPQKRTGTPSKSPSRKGSKDDGSAEPTVAKRGRPKSPAKAATRSLSKSPARSLSKARSSAAEPRETRSRSQAKDISVSPDQGPTAISISKLRSPGRPINAPSSSKSVRARSVSPTKSAAKAPRARESSAPQVATPARSRSKSPAKRTGLGLTSDDGNELRNIEQYAYMYGKDHDLWEIANDEEKTAMTQGLWRREFQDKMRTVASNNEQSLFGPPVGNRRNSIGSRTLESPRRKMARSPAPARSPKKSTNDSEGEVDDRRGTVVSATNPKTVTLSSGTKKNPFFEPMPAPEVWHRRMPPYLPFGETPYMEQVWSRQITDDLARGKDGAVDKQQASTGLMGSAFGALGSLFGLGKADTPQQRRASPWTLSEVSDKEVQKFAYGGGGLAGGQKRKASITDAISQPKRPRRRSSGASYDARMSGGLR